MAFGTTMESPCLSSCLCVLSPCVFAWYRAERERERRRDRREREGAVSEPLPVQSEANSTHCLLLDSIWYHYTTEAAALPWSCLHARSSRQRYHLHLRVDGVAITYTCSARGWTRQCTRLAMQRPERNPCSSYTQTHTNTHTHTHGGILSHSFSLSLSLSLAPSHDASHVAPRRRVFSAPAGRRNGSSHMHINAPPPPRGGSAARAMANNGRIPAE